MTRIQRKLVSGLLCGAGVIAVVVLLPLIVPAFWHMTHTSRQAIGPYEVIVPSRFIARRTGAGITLLKLRLGLPAALYQFETVEIEPHTGQVDLNNWSTAAIRAAKNKGLYSIHPYRLQFAGVPVACVERNENGSYTPRVALCSDARSTLIQYFGYDDGQRTLSEILGNSTVRSKQ